MQQLNDLLVNLDAKNDLKRRLTIQLTLFNNVKMMKSWQKASKGNILTMYIFTKLNDWHEGKLV